MAEFGNIGLFGCVSRETLTQYAVELDVCFRFGFSLLSLFLGYVIFFFGYSFGWQQFFFS